MVRKKPDTKSLQKTCFIFTVNLGHAGIDHDMEEDLQIAMLELHYSALCTSPNVKIVRAQIERNSKGILHINGAVKFGKVTRARTLENKWGCWAEPALNEAAVMQYGKKLDTRVKALPNVGEIKKKKSGPQNPKERAIQMLIDGMDPMEICLKAPEVYFTHHRAIIETWKMMSAASSRTRMLRYGEEE